MRHKNKTTKLGRKAGPRTALLRSLCIALVENGRMSTTLTKAKATQRMIEPLITKGADGSLASLRHIEGVLGSKKAARKIMKEISPRYKNVKGGYTRIVKSGARPGDGAEEAIIEFTT